MADLGFEQLLAAQEQAYQEAEEFSDYMPPDGEYLATVVKCSKGAKNQNDAQIGWWKLTGQLIVPEKEELDGAEFTLGFYRTSAMGVLKGQAKALNGGEPVGSLAGADKLFEESIGKVLRVKVSTSVSKKNGNEYTNCYIQEVIAAADAGSVDNSEPPQVEIAETEAP